MAITKQTQAPWPDGWCVTAQTADASGCEELLAAPAAGVSIRLDHIMIGSSGAITVTVGEGETAGAVTTTIFGPWTIAAGATLDLTFHRPIILTAATSLTIDASGASNLGIMAEGKYVS